LAKKLARYPVNGRKRTLRMIAAEPEAEGYVNAEHKRFQSSGNHADDCGVPIAHNSTGSKGEGLSCRIGCKIFI